MEGRGAARVEDAQGTPTQSHVSPSILVYEEHNSNIRRGSLVSELGTNKPVKARF